MNILVVNWTWYPSGGDWTYVENVVNVYQKKGHTVIPFSMKDDRNFETPYSEYFIENIDYKKINKRSISAGIKVVAKSIYSTEAQKNLEHLLSVVKIDAAHINVIHHYITPTILKILKDRKIPIVWTLNDYTCICPESTFVSHDEVCERCYGNAFYNCITHTCKKGSYLASTVAALESYVHQYLDYYAFVDHFICPSVFSYNKFKQFNFHTDKLTQLYYCYDPAGIDLTKPKVKLPGERYIIFVGRLEKIKGALTVLKAMLNCPDIHLKIVGTGTQEASLKDFKEKNQLNNVSFEGKKNKQDTLALVTNADFLICASEWYEVLGFTVVEAMILGRPVIGSDIGAIPEMVLHNHTGLLFEPGNHEELAALIKQLYNDIAMAERMGKNAQLHINTLINTEKHFEGLQKLIPGL